MRLMQAQAETYNLCGLSYFTGCGLRPITGVTGVTFVAVLAVGLVTAPMPQLISAALQQQANAPDKKTKMKKAKC
jgi:hypothetical protein